MAKQRKESKGLPTANLNKWPSNQKLDESDEKYDSEFVEEDDYEPTHSEIIEYAQCIGIDPIREKHLLHIAREGLITPVPPPWEAIETKGGEEIIYINRQTG